MANYKVHDNPVRDEWMAKIEKLTTLASAHTFLKEFRVEHTTPLRDNYSLELDWPWIERMIEEKVAMLKHAELTDEQFFNNCTCGANAQEVADAAIAKMDACTEKYDAEKLHINFRRDCKPPIMPTNVFMDTDRLLGTKLMELRNIGYYDMPLEELRKARGVKVVHIQDK
ncbi:MAG: methane monooxygenase [Proteobacteria bacterium]|nr:methane monooxygenase [Pseudomonadota bacterium]